MKRIASGGLLVRPDLPHPAARWLYRVCRWTLAGTFVAAGALKLSNPHAFAVLISHYGLVPDPLLGPVAVCLPLIEISAGAGLAADARGSLAAVTAMLLLFVFVLWFGILKDLDVDCGCFSASDLAEHGSLRRAMARDFGLLGMAGLLYLLRRFPARRGNALDKEGGGVALCDGKWRFAGRFSGFLRFRPRRPWPGAARNWKTRPWP
ncbi:MAG: DoxX family protein [Deltaproteobacteria bacterium]|nr:DoxX family protein [Deltaproteobacteria bacterium]